MPLCLSRSAHWQWAAGPRDVPAGAARRGASGRMAPATFAAASPFESRPVIGAPGGLGLCARRPRRFNPPVSAPTAPPSAASLCAAVRPGGAGFHGHAPAWRPAHGPEAIAFHRLRSAPRVRIEMPATTEQRPLVMSRPVPRREPGRLTSGRSNPDLNHPNED